jgi:hypothetical protein
LNVLFDIKSSRKVLKDDLRTNKTSWKWSEFAVECVVSFAVASCLRYVDLVDQTGGETSALPSGLSLQTPEFERRVGEEVEDRRVLKSSCGGAIIEVRLSFEGMMVRCFMEERL